jgi:hypothetical protein
MGIHTLSLNRRRFLSLFAAPAASLRAQGVASRGVKPQPRGKPSGIPFLARFTDVAHAAGLRAPVIYGGLDRKDYILETVGCGLAFLDYDNDGWLDILLLSGSRLGEEPESATTRLYRNNRDGTFSDVTERAGLARRGWASAVAVGDYNNDGHEDLFITYWGHNVLYRNNGDGTFSDVTREAGLIEAQRQWGSGCTFLDYDRDGHLDLFVARYLDFDLERVPKPGRNTNCNWKGVPVNCGPRGLPPGSHTLYRNDGKGRFIDVTKQAGLSESQGSYEMTAVAADFNGDGWPDIYVACDSTPSFLFMNQGDGTFREEGLERGCALNEDGMEQAGMGLGIGDYNLDGHLDIFKTHFTEDTHILYRNSGTGFFEDATIGSGLGVETRFIGWGAGMFDLDNDGLPDLFFVSGSVYPEVEKTLAHYPYRTPRVVFRNLGGGKFEELIDEAGAGVSAVHSSRGCAFGDFDNDGDIDVLVMNMNEPPSLLRNDLGGNRHWLKVQLIGAKSNRSALGARVVAGYGGKTQAQEVLCQSSFYSVNDRRLHFGLGEATEASLEIRWPSGVKETLPKVAVDRLVVIREGEGIVREEALAANPTSSGGGQR